MNAKRLFWIWLACMSLIVLTSQVAFSGAHDTIENSSPQRIAAGIATKGARGMANVSLGWIEFPKQIYITFNEDGAAAGFFIGPAKGFGMAIVRTLSGIGELATFLIPSPGFYDPIFEPGYVWQKE